LALGYQRGRYGCGQGHIWSDLGHRKGEHVRVDLGSKRLFPSWQALRSPGGQVFVGNMSSDPAISLVFGLATRSSTRDEGLGRPVQ
jgi:hypothetical protein